MRKNRFYYMENGALFVKGYSTEYKCVITCEVTPEDPLYREGLRECRRNRTNAIIKEIEVIEKRLNKERDEYFKK